MLFQKAREHKKGSAGILLFVLLGGYWSYRTFASDDIEVRYMTAPVKKGSLISTVSGNGQVSVAEQVQISSELAGKVVAIPVQNGQHISAGTVIAQLETKEIEKEVRDAEINLQSAQIALQKLRQPADSLSMLQAQNALDQAKRNLEDLRQPPDELEFLQARNALQNSKDALEKLKLTQESSLKTAQENEKKAEDTLANSYEDIFNTLSSAFLDMPVVLTSINTIMQSDEIARTEFNDNSRSPNTSSLTNTVFEKDEFMRMINTYDKNYLSAKNDYDKTSVLFQKTKRDSERSEIEALLESTLETARLISEALRNETNIFNFWSKDRSNRNEEIYAVVEGYQTDLKNYSSQINGHLDALLASQRSLIDNKNALLETQRALAELQQNQPLDLTAAEQDVIEKRETLKDLEDGPDKSELLAAEEAVREKTQALEDLKNGADPLDIASQELTVRQRQIALNDARDKLADAFIRAPFDGVVTEIAVHLGNTVSSGTAIATLLSHQKIAEISLNEVDIVKIQKDQKVTLSFDAIEKLQVTGSVVEIDTLGTITSGVVTYGVIIAFDSEDERVKPGMSVSTEIVIAEKQDILSVPSAAIKFQGDEAYVEILKRSEPARQTVEIGINNDNFTEIISGLTEGQEIVTGIIQMSPNTSNTPASNARMGPGAGAGMRIPGLGGGRGSGFGG